jgi:hypothetical protein
MMTVCTALPVAAGQLWVKCNITCRCLQNEEIGNFSFLIPLDATPDVNYDADWACRVYGHRVCLDGCNSIKFSYTYQTTVP